MVPIFSPYFDEATFDRSIKNKTDFYQVVEFDASDPKTMTKYHYNYLPEIKLFNSSDSANVTITGMNKNFMLFDYIRLNLDFDQMIAEGGDSIENMKWLHVSYKISGNRKQMLKADFSGGKVKYSKL